MINKVMLCGYLGRDPTIRPAQGGTRIASFSIATSERWREKESGERRERTEWHDVVVFNERLVELAEKYLKKGAKVWIEGQLGTRTWTDKAGVERRVTEIVLRHRGDIQMLDCVEARPAARPGEGSRREPARPAAFRPPPISTTTSRSRGEAPCACVIPPPSSCRS